MLHPEGEFSADVELASTSYPDELFETAPIIAHAKAEQRKMSTLGFNSKMALNLLSTVILVFLVYRVELRLCNRDRSRCVEEMKLLLAAHLV